MEEEEMEIKSESFRNKRLSEHLFNDKDILVLT